MDTKTQYFTASSLDGFIATEDDSLEWLFPLGDLNESSYPAFIAEVGALAMGSATYEWMLRNAEQVTAETGSAWRYTQPAWIFSHRRLPAIEGADLRLSKGMSARFTIRCARPLETETSGSLEGATSPASSTMPVFWMS